MKKLVLTLMLGVLSTAVLTGCTSKNENAQTATAPASSTTAPVQAPMSKNRLTKSTFAGQWPLTVADTEIYCITETPERGGKVRINQTDYAITENVNNIPFLPESLWLAKQLENGNCNGVVVNGQCKVALDDLAQYALSICD